MQPDPHYMDIYRVEHRERLMRAATRRTVTPNPQPNKVLLKLGTALVAAGEYVQALAQEDAQEQSTGYVANFTNELHKL